MNDKIPPFYISRTLLGFGPGEPDLNRIFLQMPGDRAFVLCEMGEPRTDGHRKRWHELAEELSRLWSER